MDKAAGPTSHDVINVVRRLTGVRRVGHAGTLDPFATGLLTVLVGRATRLAPYLVGLDKTYTGMIILGRSTDTDDATGTVTAMAPVTVTDAEILAAMERLTGTLEQHPPAYSAKKVRGRPAHRRARRGETVALPAQTVTVHRFALVRRDGPHLHFAATVGSGTYVRALARDLGLALGCGAHVAALRRTEVGPWSVDDAVPLAALEGAPALRPPRDAVAHLPVRVLSAEEADAVRHGRDVTDGDGDGAVALVADGDLVAVAVARDGRLHPAVVLAA